MISVRSRLLEVTRAQEDELDSDIQEQLNIFEEEKLNDLTAGGEDFKELATQLVDSLKGSAVEAEAKATFGDMLSIGTKKYHFPSLSLGCEMFRFSFLYGDGVLSLPALRKSVIVFVREAQCQQGSRLAGDQRLRLPCGSM
jgi:hypothetical protein